ncbi:MAG: redoxin domain-containing protein [Myxococcales bacterium]|nr:redoxin domain-containing protein [Myxococcales bacterium]
MYRQAQLEKYSLLLFGFLLLAFSGSAWALDADLTGQPSMGPEKAPVQVVEFSDFQCPHCAKMAPVLHEVVKQYGDLVRMTVVSLAAPAHPYAEPAAELALTAAEHGKYWEAYLQLFGHQNDLGMPYFLQLGKQLGIPEAELQANLAGGKHRAQLKANFMMALRDLNLEATPTVFINDTRIEGAKSADTYRYYINEALKEKKIASPVGEVAKPAEAAGPKPVVVPLDMIFPVPQMAPRDSRLKVKVGDPAPDFELPSIIPGNTVKLSAYRGRKNVVLSFVPAAWTPQCSAQWPEYNEYKKQFDQLNTEIIGITVDNVPTLFSWTVSMGRPWFDVVSDFWPHGQVAARYGILRTNGVSERAVFVIDKTGVIRYIDIHDINTRPDIQVLLDELKKLPQ